MILKWRGSWCQYSAQRRLASSRSVDPDKIRNIGIVAHIDAGKTTTTERMLFYSGETKLMGNVDSGDTVTDFMKQERERGITIQSAAVTFRWKGFHINLIDTPGHADFTHEVQRSLRVLDGAVVILDASAGVEAQTLKVWHQAEQFQIPSIVFLNKVDKPAASISSCLESISKKLKIQPLLMQVPLLTKHSDKRSDVDGLVDLISLKKLLWNHLPKANDPLQFQTLSLSESDLNLYMDQREELILTLSDLDEDFALQLGDNLDDPLSVTPKSLNDALSTVVRTRKGVAVLAGAALRYVGVQPLLDAVCNFLPPPFASKLQKEAVHYEPHLCALAFKIIHDRHRGPLSFVRIYAGDLQSHSTLHNVNQGLNEPCQHLYIPHADEMEEVDKISAGHIAVVMVLSKTITGDTLTDKKASVALAQANAGQREHDSVLLW